MKRIPGEPRRRASEERKLRALIHKLPDETTLVDFLRTLPENERAETLRIIRRHGER